jgi:alpha-methylacyl-CoA racemase
LISGASRHFSFPREMTRMERALASRLNAFLTGLKVVDFSCFLPGPLASLLLADMGAEVLKIEPPSGDEMQRIGPRNAADESIYYNAVNAGKQSRRMDLKRPPERLEALELIRAADVLIEGFRPGVMARLGLDYETLRQDNAGLIYCSLNGYGANGPMANAAGHDGNYLSLSGALHRNGVEKPMFFDPPVADTSGSLFAVIAILGALEERRRTGKGCQIDLALADVIMPLQLFPIAGFGADGVAPERSSNYLNGGVAYYQVYETQDGRHAMLGAIEPKFWRAFCLAAGRPEWVARQFESAPQRQLIAEVAELIGGLDLAACLARFESADCCFTPVLDLGEAIGSPHHSQRDLVRRGPDGALQALFPVLIDGLAPASRPPLKTAGRGFSTAAKSGG